MKNLLLIALLISFSLSLAGCVAQKASYINMTPSTTSDDNVSTDKVLIVANVKGGKETNPLMLSQIGDEDYHKAIVETLRKSKIFKEIKQEGNGDYKLITQIISHEIKRGEEVMETLSVLFVNYKLVDLDSNKEIWKESVFSQYGAKISEEFVGYKRVKLAHEGSARENLKQLSYKLSQFLSSY